MDYVLDGASLGQMTLTGHFTLVRLRPRILDHRPIIVDQVSGLFIIYVQLS